MAPPLWHGYCGTLASPGQTPFAIDRKNRGFMADIAEWIRTRGINEIECLIPDMNGVLRGKVLPASKLVQFARDNTLRLPSSVFTVTITGDYADVEDDDES